MTGLKNIIRSMKGNRSLYSSLMLQTVIIMLYIWTISAELTQTISSTASLLGADGTKRNANQVTTYDDCKKYLCKYGYLTCDCRHSLSRHKRQLPDGMLPTEYVSEDPYSPDNNTRTQPPPSATTSKDTSKVPCNEKDITVALETFQGNYRLNITGVCDDRTKWQMSQRRCGQPDNVIDKIITNSTADEPRTKRKARSLTDVISSNIEMEETIEFRKKQLKQYMRDIELEQDTASPSEKKANEREKRSGFYMAGSHEIGTRIHKERVSWRLMIGHRSPDMSEAQQRSILRQAFRYWSEVAPLCFYEDNDEQRVDIEIGFLEGVHLSCYMQFDGYGGEIAHKFVRDVHFDNSERYTTEVSSNDRISLLLVAVHEIGHVIGLNHSKVSSQSVMNAMYHQDIQGSFELTDHDRAEVKRLYGPCGGRFDAAFDYVRTKPGTANTRIYNTFFFRDDHYWMYDNAKQKSKFGYPRDITTNWPGLPDDVDAFLHYWELRLDTLTFYDEYIFFKDSSYYLYDLTRGVVIHSGLIQDKFGTLTGRIPSNLDAVFYDNRPHIKLIYFFKDSLVYSYKYSRTGAHSCCVTITPIIELFPPATTSEVTSSRTYASKIDAVYYSNSMRAMYFIKGNDVWQNTPFSDHPTQNSMKYVGKWNTLWEFICDGECS